MKNTAMCQELIEIVNNLFGCLKKGEYIFV
jgi:hypothetical protein